MITCHDKSLAVNAYRVLMHRPDGIRSGLAGRYSLLSASIISQVDSVFKYRIMKFLCIFVQRKKRDIMLMTNFPEPHLSLEPHL